MNQADKREANWCDNLVRLKEFRKTWPHRWPQASSKDALEKTLGGWCQDMRLRFKSNKLPDEWIKRLRSNGFNLGGHEERWNNQFLELKEYVQKCNQLPSREINPSLYSWVVTQALRYPTQLSDSRKASLASIGFLDLYKETGWDVGYQKLKEFIYLNNHLPTEAQDQFLYFWIHNQQRKFKNGRLSAIEVAKLETLNIRLSKVGRQNDRWSEKFNRLIQFLEQNNGRYPVYEKIDERELSIWCKSQRQHYKGTSVSRKFLPQEKVDKLNSINFRWSAKV